MACVIQVRTDNEVAVARERVEVFTRAAEADAMQQPGIIGDGVLIIAEIEDIVPILTSHPGLEGEARALRRLYLQNRNDSCLEVQAEEGKCDKGQRTH
jgi:hypothetical protein